MLALEQLLIFIEVYIFNMKEVKRFLPDFLMRVCNSSGPVRFRPPTAEDVIVPVVPGRGQPGERGDGLPKERLVMSIK